MLVGDALKRVQRGWQRNQEASLIVSIIMILAAVAGMDWRLALLAWLVAILLLLTVIIDDNAALLKLDEIAPTALPSASPEGGLSPAFFAGLAVLDMPVYILDDQANVLFQNAPAVEDFGLLPIGAHVSRRLRAPAVLDVINSAISTGTSQQVEFSEKRSSEHNYIVRAAPAKLNAGSDLTFYVLTLREISDLRRIDRMRSDFVANASHELRTPLASLRGFIETLQGPAKDDVSARERFLAIMLEQATRMSRLIDDLMSLSRLEARGNIVPDQNVDLVSLLRHVHDGLMPLANELDVTINLHLPDQPVYVLGDHDELVQVFQNLIENACKYGQEGKLVDVKVTNGPDEPVEVNIIDYGAGIAAEHIPRLTERFYRASITNSRTKKGTGLGLAIAKHILTRHKARLSISSQVGQGTQFAVRF